MQDLVRGVIESYERAFGRALTGEGSVDDVAALFASEVVVSSRNGVSTGTNDDFRRGMAENFDRYRERGLRSKRLKELRVTPIDELHAVAHVTWTFTYARASGADVSIDADTHYLVRAQDGEAKVFGWVFSADGEAVLREHGVI